MTKTRVILYARVSTEMQAEEGHSIAAQLNEMRDFAARRQWQIVAEYTDPGFSGSSMNRPGLQNLFQAVQQKTCDVVLVHETSRLSRSIFDTFRIFELLGEAEVGFASVKDPEFDFSTASGRFFLTMIAAINQYYLDLLKQHTAKGKRQRARSGLYNASIAPYGYRHVGDARTPPEIVPEEAEAVRLAFELYAGGTMSFQDVTDRLNDRGYRARTGNRYSKDTIDSMLQNTFYIGKVAYGKNRKDQPEELFEGGHQAIISAELFETCRRVRRKRRSTLRANQPQFEVYLLNAMSVCNICGRTLRAQKTHTGRYYREMSRARGFIDCPNAQVGMKAETAEAQIDDIFRRLTLPLDWQAEVENLLDNEAETVTFNNQRARIEAQKRRLRELYVSGHFEDDLDAFEQETAHLQRELDALPNLSMESIEAAARTLEDLGEVWDEADPVARRDLLRLVLSQVELDVRQKRIVSLTPYAPFLPLFRQAGHLLEIEAGRFIPLYPYSAEAAEEGADEQLPAITAPPETAVDWPQIIQLPHPVEKARISPILSRFLKARREAGTPVKTLAATSHAGCPALLLDTRKWPGLALATVSLDLEQSPHFNFADGGVSFLHTPFTLQGHPRYAEWLTEVSRVLDVGGWWVLQDRMPASMPGHWLYRYFPETKGVEAELTLSAAAIYRSLTKHGFEVSLEQKTYYQPVSLGAALAMARERGRSGLLSRLRDDAWQSGLEKLASDGQAHGLETLLPSHFCVAEVVAVKVGKKK